MTNLPDAVAIDANGFWWRVWDGDGRWSMVPTNPDNSPIPQPVTFYRLVETHAENLHEHRGYDVR